MRERQGKMKDERVVGRRRSLALTPPPCPPQNTKKTHQGLWTVLEPVGRRVNIETVANKKLAIGAL